MAKRHHHRLARCHHCLAEVGRRCTAVLRHGWQSFRARRRSTPVEILITDSDRRRSLERELRWGLGRLQRALDAPFPAGFAVIVQQFITTDRQLAGCYQQGQRSDGKPVALVRLALQVNGRRLGTDELLAALAEQCIGLATQQGGTTVLVPIDLDAGPREAPPAEIARVTALRSDPLAPVSNGTTRREHSGYVGRVPNP